MGSCLGVIFAFLVFVATAFTLVFQWNTNATLEFERTKDEPAETIIQQ